MTANGLVIKTFRPQEAKVFLDEVSKNENVINLIRQSFSLKIKVSKGVTDSELERIAKATKESELKQLLTSVVLVGESDATLTVDAEDGNNYRKSFVVFNRRAGTDKYDILVVQASQVKEFDYRKLTACGLGAIISGIAVGLVTANPAIGVCVGGAVAAASGSKAVYDYKKQMPDVVSGYILDELVKQKYLQIKPNDEVIFAIE
jgi:hypothetical protein